MIKRIVKLSFDPALLPEFMAIFEVSKDRIRAFPGCHHLELWRDRETPNLLFTFSYWKDEEALAAYRRSDLFTSTWAKTKLLFNDRPLAWSIDVIDQ